MVRKTISLTEDLDRRIRKLADARGLSYSAAVVALLEEGLENLALPYEGAGEGPRDLALNAESYLDQITAERRL